MCFKAVVVVVNMEVAGVVAGEAMLWLKSPHVKSLQ